MYQLLYINGEFLVGALLLNGDHDSTIILDLLFVFVHLYAFRSIWAVKVTHDYTSRSLEWTFPCN